ncbi:MAG: LysM peptidoglycan-binding domain-containing protein [Verrucomicrobiae bacterium]|nr:LysM peptidoglycan-binding domain-containing protein [Verrucomicrobiae bacterium]
MARIKLVLAFLALVLLAAGGVAVAYYWKKVFRPNLEMEHQIEHADGKNGKVEAPDLGNREFEAAVDLLKEGELISARDRLYYLMKFYPESASFPEAKRIVGDINMDLLISRVPLPKKQEHVVGRDYLSTIARKYDTTLDYIMRANGRTTTTIYPGDRLTVYPLNFTVVVDLAANAVRLEEDGQFFCEYPIRKVNLPPTLKAPAETTVSEKVAWKDGRGVSFDKRDYFGATKWIRTGKIGLFIRAFDPSKEEPKKEEKDDATAANSVDDFGVMVDRSDLEEMFTVLRTGSTVKLVK